jgi:hypothetical protein
MSELRINKESFGERKGFLFAFSSGPWTVAYIFARGSLENALTWAVDTVADHYPGLLCEPEYEPCAEHATAYQDDCDECRTNMETAEADLTYCDPGRWIPSETWTIVGDQMTPRELLAWWHEHDHDGLTGDVSLA